ncbi:hypothetical protein [Sphingomonas sp.]|uniref:hypothetical protein n=1 Tax=Sphingomonas sp. TaxID=28214 RepID=UPI0025EF39A2|nr:hypothetical protein [Sphingomonas sp.]MBV9527813.1 hypothetical protein [Sphingomonas sp.]
MEIAFIYIAEAYQCYHGAGIAIEIERRTGRPVTSFYADPATPRHLERIHSAFGAPPARALRLRESLVTRALRGLKYLGVFKHRVQRDNREVLDRFDAIVSVENTVAMARDEGIERPKLIYTPHGFGDRAYAFVPRIAAFDFVLLAGAKTERRMLANGLIRPGDYALTGSVKLETGALLAEREAPLFAEKRPTVLYNPHFDPKLTSWGRFVGPMLDGFQRQDMFNLVVAPHVKLFRRSPKAAKERWRRRSTPAIVVDPGSDRSIDTSYLWSSDVYVGDSSSQVYEFLARPRPCVFLNAHRVDWRNDPNFVHWHLGDVVDDPAGLMSAIAAAPGRHALYIERQRQAALETFGSVEGSPSKIAADAILGFLNRN